MVQREIKNILLDYFIDRPRPGEEYAEMMQLLEHLQQYHDYSDLTIQELYKILKDDVVESFLNRNLRPR